MCTSEQTTASRRVDWDRLVNRLLKVRGSSLVGQLTGCRLDKIGTAAYYQSTSDELHEGTKNLFTVHETRSARYNRYTAFTLIRAHQAQVVGGMTKSQVEGG